MGYRSGDLIPKCASYTVTHLAHEGISVVIGAAGDTFPPCKTCGDAVVYEPQPLFETTRSAILADHPEFIFPNLRGSTKQAP
jgi:hypothetical protein